jgi:hypothetical protein
LRLIKSNKIQINSNTKSQSKLQLPDVSQTLDNPGPPDTKISNAVDEGERKKPISTYKINNNTTVSEKTLASTPQLFYND